MYLCRIPNDSRQSQWAASVENYHPDGVIPNEIYHMANPVGAMPISGVDLHSSPKKVEII
ncbi:hypothetical protein BofuT4_P020800.1 [Botrytis cinerea T4]|uniref:Uncharacterized protein n=1 Tax=Botryotinia fuckeliana (strain T4) TaxID=999810 RepID=G2YJ87_BOTF4|nr:hypothetical protein BofuT4_P020800.1 [Botrytis cinerea T4]